MTTRRFPALCAAVLVGAWALPATSFAQGGLIIYPKAGQSQEQQNKDQGECHVWAVQQTGFDPANPPPPPAMGGTASSAGEPAQGGLVRGAARGAVVGGVVGAIAGDTKKGLAIGAASGGLVGGMRRSDQRARQQHDQREYERQQQAQRAQYDAQMAQQRDTYHRAVKAWLAARDYTVQ